MTQVVKASVTGTEYLVSYGLWVSGFYDSFSGDEAAVAGAGFYDSFSGDEAAVAGVPA